MKNKKQDSSNAKHDSMKQKNNSGWNCFAMLLFLFLSNTMAGQEKYVINGIIRVNPKYNSLFQNAELKIKGTNITKSVGNDGVFYLELSRQQMSKDFILTISESEPVTIKLKKEEFWSVDIKEYTIYFKISKETVQKPDRDGDGIPDDSDACPDDPGKGCADNDKDGVPDSLDSCPDQTGLKSNNGCPDDGIKRFPIPYPKPSAIYSIPWNEINIEGTKSFEKVDKKICDALSACKYEKSYYVIPNGFAIITQMEQIQEDGVSLPEPQRSSNKLPTPNSFYDYIESLVIAPEGHFRIIVFLVTDVDLTTSGKTIKKELLTELAEDGYSKFY